MDLREAIEYRIMVKILNRNLVDKYYDRGKIEFKKKIEEYFKNEYYSLITLSEFVDDIIVDLCRESSKRHLERMTMGQILGEEKINEEERGLFEKISKKINEKNKEVYLNGIPEEILKNEDLLSSSIQIIDDAYYRIVMAVTNEINSHYDTQNLKDINKDLTLDLEDNFKSLKALSEVSRLKEKCNYSDMDDDEFLECYLKRYNKDIESTNIPLHKYND